jgi:hypothetical protein
MTAVTFTSSGSWTAPAGVTSVQVECWGEGGKGANGIVFGSSGGGGGGGEYAKNTSVAVSAGGGYSYTIGSGGSGTDTSFPGDAVTITAHHGGNGSGTSAGSGGSGSGATTHFSGGNGAAGAAGGGSSGGGGGSSAGTAAVGGNASGSTGGTAPSGGGNGGGGGGSGGSGSAGTAPGGGGGGGGGNGGSLGAGAAGQITLTYTTSTSHSGTATLAGSGTLTGTGAFAGKATLTGSGTLTWSGSRVYKATVLNGSGTLTGTRHGNQAITATLTGSGTLTPGGTATYNITAATYTATYTGTYTASPSRAPDLSGSGTLTVSGVTLGFQGILAGTGTLTIIGTGGTVQASAGLSSPYARPGTSQVAVAPPGTTSWQYLGTLGLITSLTYSFVCPGGADKLQATIMIPATYRSQLLNPGWQVRVTRGGHVVWTGRLDEPVYGGAGVQVTAVGDGQRGQDFRAVYTSTWPSGEPDQAIDNAISRGLPWLNPGVGTPSGIWLGQAADSGSSTIADLLNLACTRGGLTWYASSQPGGQPGTDLSVFPLPTAVNRLLVVTDPVTRTLGGDINTIYIRYQVSDASSSTSGSQQATFGLTSVTNAASVAAHGVTETNVDLASAGTMSQGAAQAVGNKILQLYVRASFAGPFTAARGQLLNTGGAPIDPGTDQAGTVIRLILTDYAYGGEVTPAPITFITGGYTWDDFAGKATITPYQQLDQSLSGLLSMESTILTPITTQQ